MTKFKDIIKDTTLKKSIDMLIKNARENFLRDLGKNDFYHSESVEKKLDEIVPDSIKRDKKIFSDSAIFFLLCGAYLHDIGRKINEYCHEKATHDEILEHYEKYGLRDIFHATAVAEICYGHAKETERKIKDIDSNYSIEKFGSHDLQFLAAILRLADELDDAYTRVQGIKSQEKSPRNIIRCIDVNSDAWSIDIQCDTVNLRDKHNLENIKDEIQGRLNDIKDILKSKGLHYNHVDLKIKKIIEEESIEEINNIKIGNDDLPYFKTKSNSGDCILFGDIQGFSRKIYYFYSRSIVTIEKLEKILRTYDESLRRNFQFNYPSFLINQTCNKNNIHMSWFGYGYKNFIRALKERDIRYSNSDIIEPHHSESAGFVINEDSHIFYIAVLPEINLENHFEIDVGFVFPNILFDNKNYIEFYKNIDLDIPDFYEEDQKGLSNEIDIRNLDKKLKVEEFLKYKFNKEYWVPKIICENPFYKDSVPNGELSNHEKIVVNLMGHDPFDKDNIYRLHEARTFNLPYGVFKFKILNMRGRIIDD